MKRPSSYLRRGNSFDIKMTPLIDVVFLLMVFFVWTASFGVADRLLPSQISQSVSDAGQATNHQPGPEADYDAVVIRVTWRDSIVGWQMRANTFSSLAEVQQRLQQIAAINPDVPAIVHPEPDTPLGHVIDIFDSARQAGFANVKFAVGELKSEK